MKNFDDHFSDFEFDQDQQNINYFRNDTLQNYDRKKSKQLYNFKNDSDLHLKNNIFEIGERIFHSKFGMGTIIELNDNKACVNFDKAGQKNVMSDFLTKK